VAAATPSGPIIAPAGTFYVLVPVRKETKEGVSRLTPGTEVKQIKPGLYETPIGPMQLKPEMLTNDLTKANVVRRSDAAVQARSYPKGVAAAPVRASTPAVTRPVETINRPVDVPKVAITDEQARAMNFRLAVLKREEARLAENSAYLWDKITDPLHIKHAAPSGLNGSTSAGDVHAVDERLAKVRSEIQALEGALQGQAK
jgi:hypothetical protein